MSLQPSKRPRESLAMFDPFSHTGLPPNDTLSSLPPLPETPRQISISSEGPVTAFFNRTTKSRHAHTRSISRDWLVDLEEEQEMDVGVKKSESQRSLGSPNKYPVLSTRQSSYNTPRNPSPTRQPPAKHDSPSKQLSTQISVPPESVRTFPPLTQPEEPAQNHLLIAAPATRLSASFQLPSIMPDASMIGDCAPPSLADDSDFDLEIETLRPKESLSPVASGKAVGRGEKQTPGRIERRETAQRSDTTPRTIPDTNSHTSIWALAQSTLLQQSPALSKHLASSSNDLLRIDPPWANEQNAKGELNNAASSSHASQPDNQSHVPQHQPRSSSKNDTMRKFPASSSASSLASVGEEVEHLRPPRPFDIGEKSTLLPSSPAKFRHLMQDDMLQDEEFHELPSFRLPPPDFAKHATPRKYETVREGRSKKSTPMSSRTIKKEDFGDVGDVSLDFGALLAKMGKPKRASGTEESFADLLRGCDRPDELDMSVMGANDTFLPSDLRPSRHERYTSSETGSPVKNFLPKSYSTHSISSSPRSRRRSKSLSEMAQTLTPQSSRQASPPKSSSAHPVAIQTTAYASPDKPIPARGGARPSSLYASPDKPIPSRGTAPTYASPERPIPARLPAARSMVTPGQAKPRASVAPHTTGSKRVSLSAGALPFPTSASLKSVNLPPPTSRSHPTTTEKPAERALANPARRTSIFPKSEPSATRASSITTSAQPILVQSTTTSLSSRSRPSTIMAKPRAELQPRTRMGSTPASTTTALLRPTHASRVGIAPPAPSAMLPPTSRPVRPAGLPQPGTTSSVHPAPSQTTRTFGIDAASTANLLTRPTTTSSMTSRLTKTSAGPLPSPTKRSTDAPATLSNHRAMSTPASTVVRAGLIRPSAGLIKPTEGSKKASNPPGGSALPRPATRMPVPTAGKTSTGQTSTAAGIAGLRARLDQLQARQASSRSAR